AALGDVQARLVDPLVGHAAVLDHAGMAQLRPVHPARRPAEPCADPRLLALQQVDLAPRLLARTGDHAAALLVGVDHAPVLPPAPDVQGGGGARRGEVLGDVHADAARADDRDLLAGLGTTLEQIGVADHLRPAAPFQSDLPRRDAGGDD